MALTGDHKYQILELAGSGYSLKKIHEKTGFAEKTIGKTVKEAKVKIVDLADQGLSDDQIAAKLGYPNKFLDAAMKECGGSGETALHDSEPAPVQEEKSVKEAFEEYQKQAEFEKARSQLEEQVREVLDDLEELEKQLVDEKANDDNWHDADSGIEYQLFDFVRPQLKECDSLTDLGEIREIFDEIAAKAKELCQVYEPKMVAARKARLHKESEDSRTLLRKYTNMPWFPEFGRKRIESLLLVVNEEEALAVADAIYEVGRPFRAAGEVEPDDSDAAWHSFLDRVEEKRWGHVRELAAEYRRKEVRACVEMGTCPRCRGQLRRAFAGSVIPICLNCNWSL